MKATKLYIDKNFLSEKLGIDEDQFVIGNVVSNDSMIEFTVFIDDSANVGLKEFVFQVEPNINIRRRRLG
jgi:hypothetical protein